MTREEMEKRMEELDRMMFFLNMKDRWNDEDYKRDREMFREWKTLKDKLEK